MASRKPVQRSRSSASIMGTSAPAQNRSRSVMSKASSSTRTILPGSTDSQRADSTRPAYASKPNSQGEPESNIQVVIRCRRRSDREVLDNSPIIVSSNGAKSQEVTIETSTPVSSLGVVNLPPTRTYPFDLVFGPEADQALLYHNVVSPMLEEVLQGYNCTLFAYGQTGTGKTYTMQGDLEPTPMGNPSAHAGMIPRVLFRLFHHLETSGTDYSVKTSYVELYNEELRDLLASDLAAPAGSTQPMGHQSNKQPATEGGGLKIFDDSNKRGVFIQGLEETPVKDVTDALSLLQKGSHRRQSAATKFNDHSSRSHTVFSITVHVKETSSIGDDLLKIGKLNLVDLAGSENIGRSGAENDRAREAGMINQSLLTLGRVINALVEKSSHIPYRESKLTRLLRDSLGGRTKTCIIATISPARANMEETLSTLDYAIRAKSIRNKPELNQRMSRNALLKEYVGEIERLKADVLAAREKNGIYFSEETWKEMTNEQELRRTECEESKKQVEIVESQLRSVREEFEQSIALLMRRDGELKMTREELQVTKGELQTKDAELLALKENLAEEVVVREAHQSTEQRLHTVAGELRAVAKQGLGDLDALFHKLDRKAAVLSSNSQAVIKHGKIIAGNIQTTAANLDRFTQSAKASLLKLVSEAQAFQSNDLKTLTGHGRHAEQQINKVQGAFKTIQAQDHASDKALTTARTTLKTSQTEFVTSFVEWSEKLTATCQLLCEGWHTTATTSLHSLENGVDALAAMLVSVVEDTSGHIESETTASMQALASGGALVSDEVKRLKEQNDSLVRLLDTERGKSERLKTEFLQQVSRLVNDFTNTSDSNLRSAVSEIQSNNTLAQEALWSYGSTLDKAALATQERAKHMQSKLHTRSRDCKRTRDGTFKTLQSTQADISKSAADMRNSLQGSIGMFSQETRERLDATSSASDDAFNQYFRAKRARINATNGLAADAESDYRMLHRELTLTSKNVEGMVSKIVANGAAVSEDAQKHHVATNRQLSSMDAATRMLVEQGTSEDAPTGRTPRKRVWQYVDQWELTRSREQIVAARKHTARGGESSNHPPIEGHAPQAVFNLTADVEMRSPTVPLTTDALAEAAVTDPIVSSMALSKRLQASTKSALSTVGALTERSTNVELWGRRRQK